MKYLIGNKDVFFEFLNSIKPEDKVGILTHNDLDGIMSARLIEVVLKTKGKEIDLLDFLQYKKGMFEGPTSKMKEKGITKLFVTDIYADGTDLEGFGKLREDFDVLLIDHHPVKEELKDTKNVIKTETADCCTFVIYNLVKDLIEGDWNELVCATMISEVSYKNPDNLKFIQSIYPELTLDNIRESKCAKLSNKIGGSLIYLGSEKDGIKKIYDLIKEDNLEKLGEYNDVIEKEISKFLEKFKKEAEFYPEKNIYYFYAAPNYNITSVISTIVSFEKMNQTVVIVAPIGDPNYLKLSARNQGKEEDMSALLNKGIEGLENASAGGHKPAAGGRIMKKDLEKFKENLLK